MKRNHDERMPQAGETLSGKPMGGPHPPPDIQAGIERVANYKDGASPDTPEANLPPLEYASGTPTRNGPMDINPRPAPVLPNIERLPEAASLDELVSASLDRFRMGRS